MNELFHSFNNTPTPIHRREAPLLDADAALLRRYKRFLMAHNLRESLWCIRCTEAGRPDGLRATVTDAKIDFECRCTVRRYRGQTF